MPRLFIIAVLVAGCSYTPVADLRVSGDKAQLYQRDLVECRQLVKQSLGIIAIDLSGTRLNKCLAGRGHSIIGG